MIWRCSTELAEVITLKNGREWKEYYNQDQQQVTSENVQAVKLYVQFFIKNRQNKLGKHVIAICVIINIFFM